MAPHQHIGNASEAKIAAGHCVGPLYETLGIDVRRPIGKGVYGYVYKQARTGNAVKIIAGLGAQDELKASLFLMERANRGEYHTLLPHFYEVWDLGSCAMEYASEHVRDQGAFAIVREDLPDANWDVDPDDDLEAGYLWNVIEALYDLEGYEQIAREAEANGLPKKEAAAREYAMDALDNYQELLEELTSHDAAWVNGPIRELFRWGFARKIAFKDAHIMNWGVRPATGELVLRDIGMARSSVAGARLEPEGDVPIHTLSGLVVLHGLQNFGGRSWRRTRRSPGWGS